MLSGLWLLKPYSLLLCDRYAIAFFTCSFSELHKEPLGWWGFSEKMAFSVLKMRLFLMYVNSGRKQMLSYLTAVGEQAEGSWAFQWLLFISFSNYWLNPGQACVEDGCSCGPGRLGSLPLWICLQPWLPLPRLAVSGPAVALASADTGVSSALSHSSHRKVPSSLFNLTKQKECGIVSFSLYFCQWSLYSFILMGSTKALRQPWGSTYWFPVGYWNKTYGQVSQLGNSPVAILP